MNKILLCGLAAGAVVILSFSANAQTHDPALSPFSTNVVTVDKSITSPTVSKDGGSHSNKESQADVASQSATFGKISSSDSAYASAVDAHDLAGAMKLVDQAGAFKGTVAKVYEPRGLAIVEFDKDYKTALTAVVRSPNFSSFPALTNLIGKNVLIMGKFIKFRDGAEIVVDSPSHIKVVE